MSDCTQIVIKSPLFISFHITWKRSLKGYCFVDRILCQQLLTCSVQRKAPGIRLKEKHISNRVNWKIWNPLLSSSKVVTFTKSFPAPRIRRPNGSGSRLSSTWVATCTAHFPNLTPFYYQLLLPVAVASRYPFHVSFDWVSQQSSDKCNALIQTMVRRPP